MVLVAGVAAAVTGCGRGGAEPGVKHHPTADTVLRAMVDAYQAADAYQDRAVVCLSYRRDGRDFKDEAPLAVRWQAPNRVHVQAYQAYVVSDGQQLCAQIRDEATRDFDGQLAQRRAPERLALADLYEYDEVLSLAFRQGLTGYPLQLDLLLGTEPLAVLRSDQATRELLEPSMLDGRTCQRVAIDTPDGRFVLWIDEASHVLRRAEYPAATFAREIAEDVAVEEVRLTAEFRGATFANRLAADAFAMQRPPQAKQVKKFVPPPREMPSELIGKTTSAFAFADLAGGTVSSDALGDKIKVLLWFNDHPACRSSVQQLNQVYQQYRQHSRVAIYAVCTEPATVSDEQIGQLLQLWQVEVPGVRDVQAFGRDLFQIPWAPTMVVLDGNNVLHIFEVGANPNLVAELPQVLERLVAGENLAGEILDQFHQARVKYEQMLARGEPDALDTAPDGAPVAAATSPGLLRLRPAWTSTELTAAGNILAIDQGTGDTTFLVHDGWRSIVELAADGRVTARHELDLPDMAAVSQLQSALDGQNSRYYVAWSLRSNQVHVFDATWHRVLSYPPSSVPHDGVQDALLADLNADGKLELCVGFWGAAGVHCVTLDGTPLWTSNRVSHVFSLAVAPRADNPHVLWVATASGQVVPLDQHGQTGTLANPNGQLIHHIYSTGDASHGATPYCGIAYGTDGRRLALGLTPEPRSQWRYTLPSGSFPSQIRFVTAAALLGTEDRQWLIAGPEGSLHVVSQDGKFTDYFHTGSSLAGIAGGHHGTHGVLVISTGQDVRAWEVSPPETASRH